MFSFCLLFGLFLNFARNRTKMSSDTLIGVFLSISLAIGATALLWVSAKVNTHILDTVMFGSILTVNDTDISVLLVDDAAHRGRRRCRCTTSMLLASLNPSLAHVRGIRVHLLEYVFVLLITMLTVACVKIIGAVLVEALLLIPAAAARNLNRSIRGFVLWSIAFSTISCLVGVYAPMRWDLPRALGRRHHPDRRGDLPRDHAHPHDRAALSRGGVLNRSRRLHREDFPSPHLRLGAALIALPVCWRTQCAPRRPAGRWCSPASRPPTRIAVALTAGTPITRAERPGRWPRDGAAEGLHRAAHGGAGATFAAADRGDHHDQRAARAIRCTALRARPTSASSTSRPRCPGRSDQPGVALADSPASNASLGQGRRSRRARHGALLLAQRVERDPHGRHHRQRPRRRCSRESAAAISRNLDGLKRSLLQAARRIPGPADRGRR